MYNTAIFLESIFPEFLFHFFEIMSLNKCQRRCAGGRPQAAPEQECNEEISPKFFFH